MSITGKKSLFRMIAQRPAKQESRRYQAQAIRAFLVDNRLLASEYKETWVVKGLMGDDEAFDFLKTLYVTNTRNLGGYKFMVKPRRKQIYVRTNFIDGGKISIDEVTVHRKKKYRFSISYGGEFVADNHYYKYGGIQYRHKASIKDVRAVLEDSYYGMVLSALDKVVESNKMVNVPANKIKIKSDLYDSSDLLRIKKSIGREITSHVKAINFYRGQKKYFKDVDRYSDNERYEFGAEIERVMDEFMDMEASGSLPEHILDFSDEQLKAWYYYQIGGFKKTNTWKFMEEGGQHHGILNKLHGHWTMSQEQMKELHDRLVPIHTNWVDDYTADLAMNDPTFVPKARTQYEWGVRPLRLIWDVRGVIYKDLKLNKYMEGEGSQWAKKLFDTFDDEMYNNEALSRKWVQIIGSEYDPLQFNPREKYNRIIKFLSHPRAGVRVYQNKSLKQLFKDFRKLALG